MLPDHPLLRPSPLQSVRAGTTIDPRNLVLRVGLRSATVEAWSEEGRVGPKEERLADDSLMTIFHEGIHWRQLHGTTVGAFLFWLRHARELETFEHLRSLSAERRTELFARRREGAPILRLSDDGLPVPPVSLSEPADPVELLRCVFFDSFTLDALFYDPRPLVRPHASLEEIFASACADAATALAMHHTPWREIGYGEVQELFRLPDGSIRRLRVADPASPSAPDNGRELTTADILEAGAIANELMFHELIGERRYHSSASDGLSLITAAPGHDPAWFRAQAEAFLRSGHGFAARAFFATSGLDPGSRSSWAALMIACDFALNPPLPPICRPSAPLADWRDLYPPLRLHLAGRGYRHIRRPPETVSHRVIALEMDELAALTGLTSPAGMSYPDLPEDICDFAALVRDGREDELWDGVSYYRFLVWCQRELWRRRQEDLVFAAAPAFVLRRHLDDNEAGAFLRILSGLACSPPVRTDADGNFDHALGSSEAFGTWFAVSLLSYGLTQDLIFGGGNPDELGFPSGFLEHEDIWPMVLRSVALGLGENPWA